MGVVSFFFFFGFTEVMVNGVWGVFFELVCGFCIFVRVEILVVFINIFELDWRGNYLLVLR